MNLESGSAPDAPFEAVERALGKICHPPATLADQVVVMGAVPVGQLISLSLGDAVGLREDSEGAEKRDRPVHGDQIGAPITEMCMDFGCRHGLRVFRKHAQHVLPRCGLPKCPAIDFQASNEA